MQALSGLAAPSPPGKDSVGSPGRGPTDRQSASVALNGRRLGQRPAGVGLWVLLVMGPACLPRGLHAAVTSAAPAVVQLLAQEGFPDFVVHTARPSSVGFAGACAREASPPQPTSRTAWVVGRPRPSSRKLAAPAAAPWCAGRARPASPVPTPRVVQHASPVLDHLGGGPVLDERRVGALPRVRHRRRLHAPLAALARLAHAILQRSADAVEDSRELETVLASSGPSALRPGSF